MDNDILRLYIQTGQNSATMLSYPVIILFCKIRNTSFNYFIFAIYG